MSEMSSLPRVPPLRRCGTTFRISGTPGYPVAVSGLTRGTARPAKVAATCGVLPARPVIRRPLAPSAVAVAGTLVAIRPAGPLVPRPLEAVAPDGSLAPAGSLALVETVALAEPVLPIAFCASEPLLPPEPVVAAGLLPPSRPLSTVEVPRPVEPFRAV